MTPREQLSMTMRELVKAINLLQRNRLLLPSIMVSFSTIDILAGLTRPSQKVESDGQDFRAWVEKYVLPGSKLPCSANDLWAARCGLLHTYTPEARDIRAGKARPLLYALGSLDDDDRASTELSLGEYVVIVSQDLFNSLSVAFDRFMREVAADSALGQLVDERAAKFLVPLFEESPKS